MVFLLTLGWPFLTRSEIKFSEKLKCARVGIGNYHSQY